MAIRPISHAPYPAQLPHRALGTCLLASRRSFFPCSRRHFFLSPLASLSSLLPAFFPNAQAAAPRCPATAPAHRVPDPRAKPHPTAPSNAPRAQDRPAAPRSRRASPARRPRAPGDRRLDATPRPRASPVAPGCPTPAPDTTRGHRRATDRFSLSSPFPLPR
jgi:hypothetical protein